MLRRAVINFLKANVGEVGGRVYQTYLAPRQVKRPYITVRLGDVVESGTVSYGGTAQIEVFVYDDIDGSFLTVDRICDKVINALHGAYVTDEETGKTYYLEWNPTTNDIVEEDRRVIGRLLRFQTAILRERRA